MGDHVIKHTAKKRGASTTTRSSRDLQVRPPMRSHYSNASKGSCRSIRAICKRDPWNWRRNGARTARCGTLEALLIVADSKATFVLSGNGDVIEPDDGLCAMAPAEFMRWRRRAR